MDLNNKNFNFYWQGANYYVGDILIGTIWEHNYGYLIDCFLPAIGQHNYKRKYRSLEHAKNKLELLTSKWFKLATGE